MKRKLFPILLLIIIAGIQPLFGDIIIFMEEDVSEGIRNNRYYLESMRLAKLAEETFLTGDYDSSAVFAAEASHYAVLSDVYVAVTVAKHYLDDAVSTGASKQHPAEYSEAETWYAKSTAARNIGEWDKAINAAHMVLELLAELENPDLILPLPATYTVRPWASSKDCFWNIAGYPWVYGDPFKWRTLYNANKSKLPRPENPNLIEPGTVLDIPSIKGEFRQGEWNSGNNYQALK